MASTEERLTKVEEFTHVAAAHIQETEENTTIMLGVIRSQGQDIRRIFEQLREVRTDVSVIKDLLHDHTAQLALILQKLDERK